MFSLAYPEIFFSPVYHDCQTKSALWLPFYVSPSPNVNWFFFFFFLPSNSFSLPCLPFSLSLSLSLFLPLSFYLSRLRPVAFPIQNAVGGSLAFEACIRFIRILKFFRHCNWRFAAAGRRRCREPFSLLFSTSYTRCMRASSSYSCVHSHIILSQMLRKLSKSIRAC